MVNESDTAPEYGTLLAEAADIRRFVEGHRAEFILRSKKTGKVYKYLLVRPHRAKHETTRFVFAYWDYIELNGVYLGWLDLASPTSFHPHTSRPKDDKRILALTWFLKACYDTPGRLADVDFFHTGRCCMCGRKLTNPTSIESGIGPECARKGEAR